ncbi:MAG: G-D-S-L family lipolytic protein [Candidatus Nephrothrix sp. EaCA]|nr:MAG: G-D-S-L family lipolytic protein [Candidatus Nephrothrix sp. EaCA]
MKTIIFLFLLSFAAKAQVPFAADIQAFKKADSIHFPGKNKILFIGSSSFTFWKSLPQDFPEYPIINRAFGGSQLLDVLRFEKEVIFDYQPKQVVIYCGENDLAADENITGKTVFERFKKLYADIRRRLPAVSVVYVSMKPSPSRRHLRAKEEEGNKWIRLFLKKEKNAAFVDVFHLMLRKNGQPESEYFLQDSLHMNAKGYKVWQEAIKPKLIK